MISLKINVILLILLLLVVALQVEAARVFHIVGTPEVPYKFRETGTYNIQGIDADIIKLVMSELNVPYRLRLISSGSRIIKEAKLGNIDMVLSFSKKSDRTYLIYPKESYKKLDWNFFVKKENLGKITFDSYADLKTVKIGATKGWSYTSDFWSAGLNLRLLLDNDLHIDMLHLGRIDAVPLNTVSALYEIKAKGYSDQITFLPKVLKSKPYFNAFVTSSNHPRKVEIIKRYDEIIQRLLRDGTIQRIFDKYLN